MKYILFGLGACKFLAVRGFRHIVSQPTKVSKTYSQYFYDPSPELVALAQDIKVPHGISSRERVTYQTASPACASCHNVINPLGFAYSSFNGLGVFQEKEPVFSETGVFEGDYVPVDTSVDLSFVFGPGTEVSGPLGLGKKIAQSTEARSCFSKKIFSFTTASTYQKGTHDCRVEMVYKKLSSPGSTLKDVLRTLASDPNFTHVKKDL